MIHRAPPGMPLQLERDRRDCDNQADNILGHLAKFHLEDALEKVTEWLHDTSLSRICV